MKSNKITVHHIGSKKFTGINGEGVSVMMDAISPRTGHGPMELLLDALGGCTAWDVVGILEKKKINLKQYRVEVEGDRAETYPQVYTEIRVKHIAQGENLTLKTFEKAVGLSTGKYCSVHANLNCSIITTVELLENLENS
ncbi:MAG: OsmC family protein [Deltaproteobacteria bacterium]|nr:OsmC family protein [Deltaproteobacteria bacterium]